MECYIMEASQETNIELQKDVLFAYLGKQTTLWLGARARAERAGGLDANLNGIASNHYKQIDALLDEYIEWVGV